MCVCVWVGVERWSIGPKLIQINGREEKWVWYPTHVMGYLLDYIFIYNRNQTGILQGCTFFSRNTRTYLHELTFVLCYYTA